MVVGDTVDDGVLVLTSFFTLIGDEIVGENDDDGDVLVIKSVIIITEDELEVVGDNVNDGSVLAASVIILT